MAYTYKMAYMKDGILERIDSGECEDHFNGTLAIEFDNNHNQGIFNTSVKENIPACGIGLATYAINKGYNYLYLLITASNRYKITKMVNSVTGVQYISDSDNIYRVISDQRDLVSACRVTITDSNGTSVGNYGSNSIDPYLQIVPNHDVDSGGNPILYSTTNPGRNLTLKLWYNGVVRATEVIQQYYYSSVTQVRNNYTWTINVYDSNRQNIITEVPYSSTNYTISVAVHNTLHYYIEWPDGEHTNEHDAGDSKISSVTANLKGGNASYNGSSDGTYWDISLPSNTGSYNLTYVVAATDIYGNSGSVEVVQKWEGHTYVYKISSNGTQSIASTALAIGDTSSSTPRVATTYVYFDREVYYYGSYVETNKDYSYTTLTYTGFDINFSTSSRTYTQSETFTYQGSSFTTNVTYQQGSASKTGNDRAAVTSFTVKDSSGTTLNIDSKLPYYQANYALSHTDGVCYVQWKDTADYTADQSFTNVTYGVTDGCGTVSGSTATVYTYPAGATENREVRFYCYVNGVVARYLEVQQYYQSHTTSYNVAFNLKLGASSIGWAGGDVSADLTASYTQDWVYQDGTRTSISTPVSIATNYLSISCSTASSISGSNGAYTIKFGQYDGSSDTSHMIVASQSYVTSASTSGTPTYFTQTARVWSVPTITSVDVADIPASGGSVSSCVVYYSQDGTTGSQTISFSTISANTLSTTEKERTAIDSRNVTITVHNKSASTTVTVYQAANVRTSHTGSTTYGTPSASFGSGLNAGDSSTNIGVTLYNTYPTWDTYTATGDTQYNGNTVTVVGTPSFEKLSGSYRFTLSNGNVTHASMGTDTSSSDSITVRVYNSGDTSKYVDISTSVTNSVVNSNYNPSGYTGSISLGNATQTGTYKDELRWIITYSTWHVAYNYYASGATDSSTHTMYDGASVAETTDNNNRYSLDSTVLTHSCMYDQTGDDTVVLSLYNTSYSTSTAVSTATYTYTNSASTSHPSSSLQLLLTPTTDSSSSTSTSASANGAYYTAIVRLYYKDYTTYTNGYSVTSSNVTGYGDLANQYSYITSDSTSWAVVDSSNSRLVIYQNTSSSSRTVTFTASYDSLTATASVTQAAGTATYEWVGNGSAFALRNNSGGAGTFRIYMGQYGNPTGYTGTFTLSNGETSTYYGNLSSGVYPIQAEKLINGTWTVVLSFGS